MNDLCRVLPALGRVSGIPSESFSILPVRGHKDLYLPVRQDESCSEYHQGLPSSWRQTRGMDLIRHPGSALRCDVPLGLLRTECESTPSDCERSKPTLPVLRIQVPDVYKSS